MPISPLKRLPAHLQQYVQNLVARGIHKNENEVIAEALELKIDRERELYELLEEGLASGPPVELTDALIDEVFESARKRSAQPRAHT